jgi:hypothetical protein
MKTKLNLITDKLKTKKLDWRPSVHLMTSCSGQWGVAGLAWVGTICSTRGTGSGVNKLHTSSPWLTFAHELGHNFNGGHSFEEGQGKTGGVMDYGDGKLSGHYQFNTKYRKKRDVQQDQSASANRMPRFLQEGWKWKRNSNTHAKTYTKTYAKTYTSSDAKTHKQRRI